MAWGIRTDECHYRTKNADKCSDPFVAPPAVVVKLGPDGLGVRTRAHDPQYDDKGEKTEDMDGESEAFYQGKLPDEYRVP